MAAYEVIGGADPQIRALRAKGAIRGAKGAVPSLIMRRSGVATQERPSTAAAEPTRDTAPPDDLEESYREPAALSRDPREAGLVNQTEVAWNGGAKDIAMGRVAGRVASAGAGLQPETPPADIDMTHARSAAEEQTNKPPEDFLD